jgi:transcriptional regulator with XRE-family HTH domain
VPRGRQATACLSPRPGVTAKMLGTMVRRLRERQELSQAGLAKAPGFHRRILEAGVQKNPSIAVLKRLARALGVPVTELLE